MRITDSPLYANEVQVTVVDKHGKFRVLRGPRRDLEDLKRRAAIIEAGG